jgi:hypothetical protein
MERLRLDTDQHLRLGDGIAWRIECTGGLVWITAAGQMHDWVLRPGESVEIAGQDILVGTLRPSEVGIWPAASAAPAHQPQVSAVPRWRALLELFARRVWSTPPVGWAICPPR